MSLKDVGYRLFSALYEMIFKEKMSSTAQKLFVGTSYTAVGMLFGALLTFIFTILGARILGPENFGNYSLVTSVSAIIGFSMAFSLTATLKYASGALEDSVRARIISTASIQVTLFVIASVIIYVLFSTPLSQAFGISAALFLFGVVYAVSLTFFVLTMNALRVLFRMRAYALLNAIQSIIVVGAFLLFVSANLRSWEYAAYAVYIANFIISAILIIYLRRYIKPQFDWFWAKKIMRYSYFSAPGAVAGAFMGIDRILINAFQTTSDVGIYNAYFMPSLTVAVLVWSIFNAAFFPYASQSSDRQAIYRTVNKGVPYLIVSLVILIIFLEAVVFVFYGRQYPFNLGISFIFALGAGTYVLFQCYSFLMASEGTSGAKVNTLANILALAVLIGFNVVLIPRIGIAGAAITLVFAYLIPTIYLISKRHVLSGAEIRD